MPDWSQLVAHGGTVGLAFELSFLVLPVVVFWILAKVSAKKNKDREGDE